MSSPGTCLREVATVPTAANRFNLDYAAEAAAMAPPPAPIIDVHCHLGSVESALVYARAAQANGVALTYSMSPLEQVEPLSVALGERLRFIAVPDYRAENRRHNLGEGYIERIERFHAAGARIAKFWAAPRIVDYGHELGDVSFTRLDHPVRLAAMQRASDLGMIFMAHIADPDTWFRTRYADHARYGTKAGQYVVFEELLHRFSQPWIAAHLGGWPEDLEFLGGLLERHANLYLDSSATKWMVRELSRQGRGPLLRFLSRFRGRILFGSDIVTQDEHLRQGTREQAYDLYASRYWALRTLFESRYVGESPIADPDLGMIDPDRYGPMDAPPLIGKHLPEDLLRCLYHDAAAALLEPLHQKRRA